MTERAKLITDIESCILHCVKLEQRLLRITEIIESIEIRCAAADGPITNTRHEMTDAELRDIYCLALGTYRRRKND